MNDGQFQTLIASLPAAVVSITMDGSDFWANDRFWELTGLSEDGFDPTRWLDVVHPDDRPGCQRIMDALGRGVQEMHHEYRFLQVGGDVRHGRTNVRVVHDAARGVDRVICCLFDITDQRAAENRLEWQAAHDPLTGLANRTEAIRAIGLHLDDPSVDAVCVMFLDLDSFKDVNDTLGHDRGDLLLQAVAGRIDAMIRPQDLLARLGGDEFLLVCPGVADPDSASSIASRILRGIVEPVVVDGIELRPSASVGLAIGRSSDVERPDPISLIRDADTAMYEAKRRGRKRVEMFGQSLRRRVLDRVSLENELRNAIDDHHLLAHYQPIVDCWTGEVYGLESLVRWRHPHRGVLAPGAFLATAAACGLSGDVDREVLALVAADVASEMSRLRQSHPRLRVGVNLSGASLADSSTTDAILRLDRDGYDLGWLVVEVTESELIDNLEGAVSILGRLRDAGVTIALDDFGVGYSSLTYLRQIPADYVKLDKSFVRTLDEDVSSRIIAAAVVDMAHQLGLVVVAEGVETPVHLEEVRAIGVDSVQGFGIAHPAAFHEIVGSLDRARLAIIGVEGLASGAHAQSWSERRVDTSFDS